MPLFFSRRRYLRGRFNNAASDTAHHLDVTFADALSGRFEGGFTDRSTWVERAIARSRDRRVLVYVHGYNTPQRGMIANLRKIETGLSAPFAGTVVGFDWPSDGRFYAYNWDRKDIEAAASSLIDDCIGPLIAHPSCKGVSVLAHSRGCFLTLRALLADRMLGGARQIDNVMFAAADVRALDVKPGTPARRALERTTRRFTNYHSTLDSVLWLSQVANGSRPRLGRSGLMNPATLPHTDVRCTEQYVHDHGSRPKLSHNFWFANQAFYRDVSLTLGGKPAASMPTRRRVLNSADHALWVR